MKVTVIDPPSGWQHGFPKPLPEDWIKWTNKEFKQWFIDQGYPSKDVDMALKHSRYWTKEIE